jgi:hypothetical protein
MATVLCLGYPTRPPRPVLEPQFYVAPPPRGAPGGDGSRSRPWDLATALAGGRGAVQPGDTIWLLGGVYAGRFAATLTGTSGAPIVVRQYPGQRATIDGNLRVDGAFAIYWGFEITQANPVANANDALETYGPDCKFINLVVHDAGKQGMSFWEDSGTSELYGSIFYNNGTHENLDHGVYAASEGGEKWIVDNIVFDNLAYGIHVYAGNRHPFLSDVHVRGNTAFNTGAISRDGFQNANLLIGGDVRTEHMSADSNLLYFAGPEGRNLRLGMPRGDNRDILVRGNYVAGGAVTLLMTGWTKAEVADNEFIGAAAMVDLSARGGVRDGYAWHGNRYVRDPAARAWRYGGVAYDFATWRQTTALGSTDTATATAPATPRVFVRPNRYEPGRATVVVYNWGRRPTVRVDVSSAIRPGAHYELRNVQALFGPPLLSGTYGGGVLEIPMGGVDPPRPVGRPVVATPAFARTGPAFDVFILTSGR